MGLEFPPPNVRKPIFLSFAIAFFRSRLLGPLRGAHAHSLADQIAVKLRGSLRIFSARIVGKDEFRPTDQYFYAVGALCRFGFKISS